MQSNWLNFSPVKDYCGMLKKSGYIPTAGKSYIVSGFTTDAALGYLVLYQYFQKFP